MSSVSILLVLFLLFQTSPAPAQPTVLPTCVQITPSTSRCGGSESSTATAPQVVQTSGGGGSQGTTSGPVKTYLPYDKIQVGPDGEACIGTAYYEAGTPQPIPVQGPSEADEGPGNSSSLYWTAPPCPPEAPAPGQIGPVETPAMVARRHWEDVVLPTPVPQIAPGRAITGKVAYLETNGQTRHVYRNTTVFGPLEIVATGSYTVDWGDGETSGPHASEGEPWPDGQITHQYQNVGHYDIVVVERWSATWRLGGQTGVLRDLQTDGRIEDFPVQQIQAVIGR